MSLTERTNSGTAFRIKRRYAGDGLAGTLKDRFQAHRRRKLDDRAEAHLTALACSPAPEGHEHRNMCPLADRMAELGVVESLSYEAGRHQLALRYPGRQKQIRSIVSLPDRQDGEDLR